MLKLPGNNKGLTLVELIISITILAIITVPVMASFASITAINLRTRQQQELEAVMGIIRTEVVESVKNKSDVDTDTGSKKLSSLSLPVNNIKIRGKSEFNQYRYDVLGGKEVDKDSFGYIKNTYEYEIKVKKKKGSVYNNVQVFRVQIYQEP